MHGFRRYAALSVFLALPWSAAVGAGSEPEMARTSDNRASVVLWQPGDPGERLFLRGRVVAGNGKPVAGATVALRQTDGTGQYQPVRYRAMLYTDKDGTFSVSTVLPGQYWGPRHIHFSVSHENHGHLIIRILFKGDPHLNEAREYDSAILLEEVHKDGEKMLVGGVELVLPPKVGN